METHVAGVSKFEVQQKAGRPDSAAPRPGQPFNPYKIFTGIFIPEALVRNPDISPGAKIAYGRLARYAGEDGDCHPSVKTLAREIGIRQRQAQRYLAELETHGFIRSFARYSSPNTRDTNGYIFLWHESLLGSLRRPVPPVSDVTPPPASLATPPVVSEMAPKESHREESHFKENVSSSSDSLNIRNTPPPTPSPGFAPKTEFYSATTADDDESATVEFKSETDELAYLIEKATGHAPDGKLIETILDRLRLREMSLRAYIDDTRTRLRRLRRRAGPGFFYSQASEPARSKPVLFDGQKCGPQSCSRCRGIGKTTEGQYCDCQMGRDLARIEKPARKAPQFEATVCQPNPMSGRPS